jgi:acetyl/propionyl-CoA carboxylase alpha subunit
MLTDRGIYEVFINGRIFKVEVQPTGEINVAGYSYTPEIVSENKNKWVVQVNDYTFRIEYFDGRIFVNGKEVDFTTRLSAPKIDKGPIRPKQKTYLVQSIIPGTVVEIFVKPGDQVRINQPLCYLDAMKMKNEIRSPIKGIISTINVTNQQSVKKGETMFIIKPDSV